MSGENLRQFPRFRLALPVRIDLPSGAVTTSTVGVSRGGLSLRLAPHPDIDDDVAITIWLPNGRQVQGRGRCRSHMPAAPWAPALVGMSLELDPTNRGLWEALVDEEESTGSLWRMIGRIANAPDDALAPRGVIEEHPLGSSRFHTVGENGLAYRLAFAKHDSDVADDSDLCLLLPGFREPARRLVQRVLRQDMSFRLDESGAVVVRARVVELKRGGWAYVQGDERMPVGLVSLGVGELLLVEEAGVSVFPHFTAVELEQIACDSFRHDLTRPAFARATTTTTTTTDPKRFQQGYDAVRFAQAAATDAQVRRYGDRDIFFHPSVWAKVVDDDGGELMGPTLQDGGKICVLALVGRSTPRVVPLHQSSEVSLLKPPR